MRVTSLFRQGFSRPGKWGALSFAVGLALVVVAGTTTSLYADFDLAHWQFLKPVQLPSSYGKGQLVEVPLDREVYREARPGESDLRVIAGRNREVPYQLVIEENKTEWQPVPVKLRDIGSVVGQYSSFVADLGSGGRLHNEVVIEVSGSNFRHSVTVETSTDGETWALVQEKGEIFDFTSTSKEFNARDTGVRYPESAGRFIRVKVLDFEGKLPEIGGASVFLIEERSAKETTYQPVRAISSDDPEAGVTIHELEVGASGIPLSRLSFDTSSVNFHRRAVIEGSEDGADWAWLAEGDIYSFDTPKFVGSNVEVNFPERRFSRYRFTVVNVDDSSIDLTDFRFHGVDRKVLFHPLPGIDHFLYYGNPLAAAPSYDLERVVPYLDTDDTLAATLGKQEANKAFSGYDVPVTERLPWLLPSGVAIAAVVVAFMLYGVIRQARRVLPPPNEESST